MSELIDLRVKITPETDKYLDAMSRATGEDRCQIVRRELHNLALQRMDELKVAYRELKAKGLTRDW